jgi:hypothetical protein
LGQDRAKDHLIARNRTDLTACALARAVRFYATRATQWNVFCRKLKFWGEIGGAVVYTLSQSRRKNLEAST